MQKFDEMYAQADYGADSGAASLLQSRSQSAPVAPAVRAHYRGYAQWLQRQSDESMRARREEAEVIFRRVGITFAVYGAKDEDGAGTERLIPFDLIPRVIPAGEWATMERGLVQRVTALNRFLHDVYHEQEILRAGVVPREQVERNSQFRAQMMGVDIPNQVYSAIAGIDIVRAPAASGEGIYYVLEDNLRVPSGVSYMLENRKMMMRLFPELFSQHRIAPVAHYPDLLLETLRDAAPPATAEPTVVVLTPGMYNSAYFEHAFLAQQMGVELVEGQDLFVKDKFLYMRTTRGPERVDVIYRRVDDDFLDPQVFRSDSTLGCEGLMEAYRAGNVALCNAVGTGVADDKSIYPYVPKMIEFYLGREADPEQCADLPLPQSGRPEIHAGQSGGAGGQGSARRGWLRHADRAGGERCRDRAVPPGGAGRPRALHRAADPVPVELPDLRRCRHCAAPHRPAAVRAVGQEGHDGTGRPDPSRPESGLAGGEFLAGRRYQGHLDPRAMRRTPGWGEVDPFSLQRRLPAGTVELFGC